MESTDSTPFKVQWGYFYISTKQGIIMLCRHRCKVADLGIPCIVTTVTGNNTQGKEELFNKKKVQTIGKIIHVKRLAKMRGGK